MLTLIAEGKLSCFHLSDHHGTRNAQNLAGVRGRKLPVDWNYDDTRVLQGQLSKLPKQFEHHALNPQVDGLLAYRLAKLARQGLGVSSRRLSNLFDLRLSERHHEPPFAS